MVMSSVSENQRERAARGVPIRHVRAIDGSASIHDAVVREGAARQRQLNAAERFDAAADIRHDLPATHGAFKDTLLNEALAGIFFLSTTGGRWGRRGEDLGVGDVQRPFATRD